MKGDLIMRKVTFFVDSGYVGGTREEEFVFNDSYTDDDIDKEFEAWLYGNDYAGWNEDRLLDIIQKVQK